MASTWVGLARLHATRIAMARRWRLLIGTGSAVLIAATLLPWWGNGGGPGELPARGDAGISDPRGLLIFLAAAACLLLATVRYATREWLFPDRLGVYVGLLTVAAAAFASRAVDLVDGGLLPWPPDRGPGFWLTVAGLALLAGGVAARYSARTLDQTSRSAVPDDTEGSLPGSAGGRLDLLDLWVVAALLVAVLATRVYGLGQPVRMYFDEVYHARTATEFLQDWRYGTPHDIYEWTHPMLAKYVMAGGIALFDDYRVTARADLGATVKDAVVEAAASDGGATRGDRVFIATGSDVRVFDLSTRAIVHTYAIAGASALSEPTAGFVYAGTAQGAIYRIDTASLDDLRTGRTSNVKPPELLAANAGFEIERMFAGAQPYLLVSDATGKIVSIDLTDGSIVGRATLPDAADFAPVVATSVPAAGSAAGVLVAYRDGLALVDARSLTTETALATASPATSLTFDREAAGDTQPIYVAAGSSVLLVTVAADPTPTVTAASAQPLARMPGQIATIVFDEATKIVHALGRTPDGSGWTVYAIESRGNAVFSDAALPFEPVALGLDNAVAAQPSGPVTETTQADREELLAFAADGSIASVDVGQFAFSWRIAGVAFGALMAVCLYLLGRLLFRRRSVGLLVAFFAVVDGMLFAQSRIATGDTYAGGLLMLAFLIFAVLWLEVPRNRFAFWLGMPVLGVVLGLALGAKWDTVYAIACMAMLILLRSALGRLVTVLGMCAATGVLGWLSIADSPSNFGFFLLLLAVTAAVAAGSALRPVAWTRDELHVAIAGPAALGFVGPLVGAMLLIPIGLPVSLGPLLAVMVGGAVAGLAIGLLAAAGFWVGGRIGLGPLAEEMPAPLGSVLPSPSPENWLRPGWAFGIPSAWTIFCLAVLPLVVYVALYIPWSMPWQRQQASTAGTSTAAVSEPGTLPVIACWHVDDATGVCDDAWPAGHTGQTLWSLTAQMYDYHNYLRATHPASSPWWAWPLDLKPVWLESGSTAGGLTSQIHDGGNVVLWWLAIPAMAFAAWQALKRRSLGLGLLVAGFLWQWLAWSRIDRATFEYHFYAALPFFLLGLAFFLSELWHGPSRRTWLLARVAVAAAMLLPAALWLARPALCGLAGVDTGGYFAGTVCGPTVAGPGDLGLPSMLVPALALAGLAGAALALATRDPRHLVAGVCALAAVFFAFDYPDLAAVWVPTSVQSAFTALIPTWQYGFQFSTNLERAPSVEAFGVQSAALGLLALVVAVAAGGAARLAARRRSAERG